MVTAGAQPLTLNQQQGALTAIANPMLASSSDPMVLNAQIFAAEQQLGLEALLQRQAMQRGWFSPKPAPVTPTLMPGEKKTLDPPKPPSPDTLRRIPVPQQASSSEGSGLAVVGAIAALFFLL